MRILLEYTLRAPILIRATDISAKMGDVQIIANKWRLVEVGRVVLFSTGPYAGRIAAIVEIIDHKRVRCEIPDNASVLHSIGGRVKDMEAHSNTGAG